MSRSASFTTRMFCSALVANYGKASRSVLLHQLRDDGEVMPDVEAEIFTFTPEEAAAFEVGKVYDVTFTPAPVA